MSTFVRMKPRLTATLGGMVVLLAGCASGPAPVGATAQPVAAGAPAAPDTKHLTQVQKLAI